MSVDASKIKVNEIDGTVTITIPSKEKTELKVNFFFDNMLIIDAERDDSGRYTLGIANDSGSTTVNFRLKVRSPPGPPEGPLETKMAGKTRCNLQWKQPKDDGGSKVTHYIVEKRDCAKGDDFWLQCAETRVSTT